MSMGKALHLRTNPGGILVEITGQSRWRLYAFDACLNLFLN